MCYKIILKQKFKRWEVLDNKQISPTVILKGNKFYLGTCVKYLNYHQVLFFFA